MNHLKSFALTAVAAMALMAIAASSASATTLKGGEPERTLGSGDAIDFSIPGGGSTVFVDTENEEIDKCTASTLRMKLSSGNTGSIEELDWTSCTFFPTQTVTLGKLEFVSTGGTNGEVKADANIEVTINTLFFGSCIYGITGGTKIGTLAGNPATFTANALIEKFSGPAPCPSTGKWTGSYISTQPTHFHIEP